MGLDSLFERLVVAVEKIAATAEEINTAAKIVNDVAGSAKRGKKKAEEPASEPTVVAVAAVKAEVAEAAATPAPQQKSFLDDEEEAPEVDPFDKLDEKGKRAQIRAELINLQKALDPERALKVLVSAGKCEILSQLKPENFAAVREAIAKAMPKKAA